MNEPATSRRAAKILVVDDSATVLRVVEFVLAQAGYEVLCVEHGKDVVYEARRQRPDLIFVDFSMPEVSGYDVCRMLGEDPELEAVPIVIMSTRGDTIGERFVRDIGVVDHITKPFAPEALLAVVQHTLRKTFGTDPSLRRRSVVTSAAPEPLVKPTAGLAQLVAKGLGGVVRGRNVEERIAERIEAVLDTDAAKDELRSAVRDLGGGPALTGDLSRVPLAEVLQMLSLQRQSGILTVSHGKRLISIAFKEGRVRLVTGENLTREFLLGTILVREKLIEPRELELFLANRKGTRRRLGQQVVKLGYMTQTELVRALQRQSSELMYELLRWGAGRFELDKPAQLPDEVLEFDLGMSMDELLMEGFRRVDEWGLIESVLPSFDTKPRRVPGGLEHVGPQGLNADEQGVYDKVDGQRTAQEIVEQVGAGAFEVARLLYRLISARVVAVDGERATPSMSPGERSVVA
jgi:DNA-binding response OmpR family regulator